MTIARSSVAAWATRAARAARSSAVAHSAARRPGRRPDAGPSGSSSARRASRWSVSASAGTGAVAAHLVATQGPGDLAGARRAARDQRAERAQLVLLVDRHQQRVVEAMAERPERERLPRPAARARPGQRPEGEAARLVQAQRGEQPAQAHARMGDRRGVARRGLPAQHGEQMGVRGARRPQRLARRVVRQRLAVHERQAVAERQLGRADGQAQQRGDDHRLGAPVVQRGLQLVVGAGQAVGRELEVGRVLEHAREEGAQRRPRRARGRRAAPARRATLQVVREPAAGRQRAERGQMRRQAAEQALALGDEVAGQRPVAVQRRVAPAGGDDLERHVGAVGGQRVELPGRLLREGGERGVELAVSHGSSGSAPTRVLLPRAAPLAAAGCATRACRTPSRR